MASLGTPHVLNGASPWSDDPCVMVTLRMEATELAKVPAAAERLATRLGHWIKPSGCGTADIVQAGRLVVEVARALLNEQGGVITTAKVMPEGDGARLVLGFHHPRATLVALEAAARLAMGAGAATDGELGKALNAAWANLAPLSPDPQASILIAAAREAGIPVRPLDWETRTWLHGWGSRAEVQFEACSRGDSGMARRLSARKTTTKPLAQAAGFAVQPGFLVNTQSELAKAATRIGFPCVLKPLAGKQSQGVTTGIRNEAELLSAWSNAQSMAKGPALIERHAPGEAYRLLVSRGRFWKAIIRPRPFVTGDGVSTVLELAKARNRPIEAALRPSSLLRPAPLDGGFTGCLARQGLTPSSVPASGTRVLIRDIPMLNQGATDYRDVTEQVHADIRAASENLSTLLGAGLCGIDLIAEDLSKPETCFFLEANTAPGLRILRAAGIPAAEIRQAAVGDKAARLPHAVILCPRERHAEVRQLLPDQAGLGWTDGRSCGIGTRLLPAKVTAPSHGLDLLVRNPSVAALALLVDPADLLSEGLPGEKPDLVLSLGGVRLEPEWSATLARVAARHVATADADEARKSLAGVLAG